MYKVLVVDDEELSREGVKLIIPWEKYGFQVASEAENGSLALSLMEEKGMDYFSLVVCDLYMPEVKGSEFMMKARERGYKGQFVILSGYSDFETARQAIKLKVAGYMLKPIDFIEAEAVIAKVKAELDKGKGSAANTGAEKQPSLTQRDKMIKSTLDIIHTEYHESSKLLNTEKIAARIGYNSAYLGREFTRVMGVSIHEYIINYRMEMAEKLLTTTSLTAEEISAKVGYTAYNVFYRHFKAKFGKNPDKIREEIKEKET